MQTNSPSGSPNDSPVSNSPPSPNPLASQVAHLGRQNFSDRGEAKAAAAEDASKKPLLRYDANFLKAIKNGDIDTAFNIAMRVKPDSHCQKHLYYLVKELLRHDPDEANDVLSRLSSPLKENVLEGAKRLLQKQDIHDRLSAAVQEVSSANLDPEELSGMLYMLATAGKALQQQLFKQDQQAQYTAAAAAFGAVPAANGRAQQSAQPNALPPLHRPSSKQYPSSQRNLHFHYDAKSDAKTDEKNSRNRWNGHDGSF